LLASAEVEFRACRLCGSSRGVSETGEIIWLDVDGSELSYEGALDLERRCPGPSGQLRDYDGPGESAAVSVTASSRGADQSLPLALPLDGKILVVEDDAGACEALAELLQDEGYGVALARNGQDALDQLKSSGLPSLILLDLLMPVMDGWQFREQQKRDAAIRGIPVIVLTALRQVPDFDAEALFHKPVEIPDLLDAVRRCCARTSLQS
jgi:CheY-like chemotaxis protein